MSTKYENLIGSWVYRSLRNNKVIDTPFNDLRFGAGIIEFKDISDGKITNSTLNMGGDFVLILEGEIVMQNEAIQLIKWRGTGVQNTPTTGWIYDYKAYVAPVWEEATDKTIVLVGTVLRAVPHNGAPAGVNGTFYMVKMD